MLFRAKLIKYSRKAKLFREQIILLSNLRPRNWICLWVLTSAFFKITGFILWIFFTVKVLTEVPATIECMSGNKIETTFSLVVNNSGLNTCRVFYNTPSLPVHCTVPTARDKLPEVFITIMKVCGCISM